jgi:hypothetical protein
VLDNVALDGFQVEFNHAGQCLWSRGRSCNCESPSHESY